MSHFGFEASLKKFKSMSDLPFGQLLGLGTWYVLKKIKFLYFNILNRIKGIFAIKHLGKNVKFNGIVRFENSYQNIIFEDNSMIGVGCYIQATKTGFIKIGNKTLINDHCYITSNYRVEIGADVLIAEMVSIRDFDHEFADVDVPISMQGLRGGPVSIGDGTWIGRGVIVTSGVSIGEGCIIGANSVVTRNIPAWSIAVGAPAKVIRSRKPNI
jgi:acetyltransferase-like isoleucine patch superfamily enzyme